MLPQEMFRISYSEIASKTVLGRKQSTIVTATCSIFGFDYTFGKPADVKFSMRDDSPQDNW